MVLETRELSLSAEIGNSDLVVCFIEKIINSIECTVAVKNQIITAVEELYANIAQYAYTDKDGAVTLRCTLKNKRKLVIIQMEDNGKPFNPLEYTEPDIKAGLRERKIGGLGIFIVKNSVDRLLYKYSGGKNIVTIIKKIA